MTNKPHITLEGDQLYFTVNGQKIRAEDVKFLSPEKLKKLCDHARQRLKTGLKAIILEGSISPPVRKIRLSYRVQGGERYPGKNPYQ